MDFSYEFNKECDEDLNRGPSIEINCRKIDRARMKKEKIRIVIQNHQQSIVNIIKNRAQQNVSPLSNESVISQRRVSPSRNRNFFGGSSTTQISNMIKDLLEQGQNIIRQQGRHPCSGSCMYSQPSSPAS